MEMLDFILNLAGCLDGFCCSCLDQKELLRGLRGVGGVTRSWFISCRHSVGQTDQLEVCFTLGNVQRK